jgi:hypothetical protein
MIGAHALRSDVVAADTLPAVGGGPMTDEGPFIRNRDQTALRSMRRGCFCAG